MEQLDISHYVLKTKVLGPYLRSALWVHGCCFDCPGCIAQKMNAQRPFLVDTGKLAKEFLSQNDTEGIKDVQIERVRGNLTDHYSPRERVLRLVLLSRRRR